MLKLAKHAIAVVVVAAAASAPVAARAESVSLNFTQVAVTHAVQDDRSAIAVSLGEGDPGVVGIAGGSIVGRVGRSKAMAERGPIATANRKRSREPRTMRNCEEPNFSFDLTGTDGADLVTVR